MTTISISSSYLPLDVSCISQTPDRIEQIWALTHDRSRLVRCHNLASARTYADGRAPDLRPFKSEPTLPVKAFVSPSGQYYVQTLSGVRIDCRNAATARYYVKNGVDAWTAVDALISEIK